MNRQESTSIDCAGHKGQQRADLFIGFLCANRICQCSGISEWHIGDGLFVQASVKRTSIVLLFVPIICRLQNNGANHDRTTQTGAYQTAAAT